MVRHRDALTPYRTSPYTSTEKPGRLGESACSPGRNTPCSRYSTPDRTSTVRVPAMGLAIQIRGCRPMSARRSRLSTISGESVANDGAIPGDAAQISCGVGARRERIRSPHRWNRAAVIGYRSSDRRWPAGTSSARP